MRHATLPNQARRRLASLLVVGVVAAGIPSVGATAATQPTELETVAQQLFHTRHVDTRQHPADNGVSDRPATTAIGGRTDLMAVARDWSARMASTGKLAHNPNLGSQVCCWRKVGENVAHYEGPLDTQEQVRAATETLMKAWIRSEFHRHNMMDPEWGEVAIGVAIKGDHLWATAVFRRLESNAKPPGEAYGADGPHPDAGRDASATPGPSPTARDTTALCSESSHPGYPDAAGTTHEQSVKCAAGHGLVNGRSAAEYVPNGLVQRGQLMTFVRNALDAAGYALDENAPDAFDDDNGTTHEQSANMLAAAGFVATGDRRLRTGDAATRGFIANVVGRALSKVAKVTTDTDWFDDDNGHADERWINILGEAGISTGSGTAGRLYGPDAKLTRGQMATLLIRSLDALRP